MKKSLQKGFTLIELLVVIAIIGLLAAALITNMSSGVEAGRSLKCKANLKSLAQAASTYSGGDGDDEGPIPTAGSFEYSRLSDDQETIRFFSSGAWVSWTPNGGNWPYSSDKSEKGNMTVSVFYDKNAGADSKAFYSITNGVLWSYTGKDASVYLCETHKKIMGRILGARIYRSFVMNRYFGYDDPNSTYRSGKNLGGINESGTASIRILFAELPGKLGQTGNFSAAPWSDSVLSPESNEYLGFNHKVGNKWVANIAFADGHVDGVVEPAGASSTDLKNLATQMCNGEEIDKTLRAKMQ